MKKLLLPVLLASLVVPMASSAQRNRQAPRKAPVSNRDTGARSQLSNALRLAQSGQYEAAANNLFTLSRRSELAAERPQIKYILGTMLMELKLYQTAAFQFVDVIRSKHPKYSKMAIEKLSLAADILGDDTILNYAISKVNVNDFPASMRDMLNFRLGEIKLRDRAFASAADHFSKVGYNSSYYYPALYSKGLAELEANKPNLAISTFNLMLDSRRRAPVTDTNRVSAQMGLARALYQRQDWDSAIQAYAEVPRDTLAWHDAVFESSWAMLRSARFRSALSNFQTLHSAYYEDFYMPESLLLRAIVYLYICKYDEMDKVLNLFERTYGPIRTKIGEFIRTAPDANAYYLEIEKALSGKTTKRTGNLRLPYIVVKNVSEQGDVKRSLHYLSKIEEERHRLETSPVFRATPIAQYALKVLNNRTRNTKIAIGDMMKAHLQNMRADLKDLYEQAGFIRYEMITGKKDSIKKKIAGRETEQIDDKIDRKFFIENGYEYYPFQGEYWLDEVGNYHYLGKQSCE